MNLKTTQSKGYLPDHSLENLPDDHRARHCSGPSGSGSSPGFCNSTYLWGTDLVMVFARL